MSQEIVRMSKKDSEIIIRKLLKRTDTSHMDVIKAQMKSITVLLSFIFDTNQHEALRAYLINFDEMHQTSFLFCYSLAEEFENEIKELNKNRSS